MQPLPSDFIQRITRQFPGEANEFIAALDTPARASIRINTAKTAAPPSDSSSIPWNDEGYMLTSRPRYTLDPKLHAGCYYPQESSSMVLQWVLSHCVTQQHAIDAIDVCAAPGGKSLILADFLRNRGRLVSNEIVRTRAHILQEVLVKWGAPNAVVINNRPADIGQSALQYDLMLVDAPCSGEGMFRKDADSRSEWTPHSANACSQRQMEILNDVLPALKQNGVLIYSTCTFAQEENEEVIRVLLATGEFETMRWPVPKEWNVDVMDSGGVFAMRFLPHRVPGEGFFIAALRRITSPSNRRPKPKAIFASVSAADCRTIAEFGLSTEGLVLGPDAEVYRSPFTLSELNLMAYNLYVLQCGIQLGRIVRNQFLPAHAAALAQGEHWKNAPIELDEQQAIAYLRGETPGVQSADGWQRLAFDGHVLGWVKVMGNRVNNYYPKEWRIKMKE
jgi:16S rRNA C967 or C1407 C5-methylase (RsmB/RsmF family)/NOL1/NOP2/fmu family ribosome biogenesis protein